MSQDLFKFLQEGLAPVDARHEAAWILEHLEKNHVDDEVAAMSEAQEIVARRQKQEPVAYILGSWAFREFEFFVGPGVLIPRPETEELVDHAQNFIFEDLKNKVRSTYHIADLGSGSGCIGLSLAVELSCELAKVPAGTKFHIVCVERSPKAFAYLKKNYENLKKDIADHVSVELVQSSWEDFKPQAKFRFVCSNPPYISEREWLEVEHSVKGYEPEEALHSGDFNKDPDCEQVYASLLSFAQNNLEKGGSMLLEHGAAQVPYLRDFYAKYFEEAMYLNDMTRRPRFLWAANFQNTLTLDK